MGKDTTMPKCAYCFEPIYAEHDYVGGVDGFASSWAHTSCADQREGEVRDKQWCRIRPEAEAVIKAATVVAYKTMQKQEYISTLQTTLAVFHEANDAP